MRPNKAEEPIADAPAQLTVERRAGILRLVVGEKMSYL